MTQSPARNVADDDWRPVRNVRASEEVVERIRKTFFAGMRPGDWLGTESDLAKRFDVSRITIRDAVRALETSGIVDVRVGARGGLRVAEPHPDRFIDALAVQLHLLGVTFGEVIQAQRAIEPIAADLAARNATDEDLERMREVLRSAREAVDDAEEFTRRSIDFHAVVADVSGNRVLNATLMAMRGLQEPKYAAHTHHPRAVELCRTHQTIFNHIAAHEPDKASAAMRRHLEKVNRKVNKAGAAEVCVLVGDTSSV